MSDLLGAAMVDIRAIADGARVELNSAQLDVLAAGRTAVLAALASGTRPVYGVNTGMGRFADVPLTLEQQAQHQRNLLIGRAVGGPPWLPERDVRGLLAARLQDFLAPEAGVSAELVRFLADRLNDGFVPAVPRAGLGSAGEIIPLAHAFQTFAGIGTVLDGDDEIPAADALSRRGVEPYVLGPKEGVSLIQGAPLARAHAVLRGVDAARAVEVTLLCTAGAVDILGAPLAGYDPALGGADSVLTDVLGEVFALVKVAAVREGVVQAPVSARVGPRAIAHARRVLRELAETVERAVGVPADSPAFIDGEFVSTTGFHAADLGLRMDAVTAALVHLGEIGVQRLHRMLDERFTGLPAQLAAEPGPHAGLSPLHKRAAGELHALRRLAAPATVGSADTSAGQEDVQAFAPAAGEQLRAAVEHLMVVSACELLAACQADHLRGANAAAPGVRAVYAWVGETVDPVLVDRPLGPDLERLGKRLKLLDA
ncbi:aromatic amino acid lyase [Amycolatopsis sp. CA-230715]|uniref:aromatic amino acid lyase n=1 Tax=Amycolatopsis sp. CA-230715 TaxID=2745196 RepID=UPI001C33283C|nr:aromatic amino acid lyase [Amycolatopsis sp. CA-230715]QWF79937.1 Histidine ammonia-lyase [Amycolatopsis sp. CA-230715]